MEGQIRIKGDAKSGDFSRNSNILLYINNILIGLGSYTTHAHHLCHDVLTAVVKYCFKEWINQNLHPSAGYKMY